jgi:amino acid transporter
MLRRVKGFLIGSPLETESLHEQRLSKKAALAVLASDNLSSSAYATEEILLALTAGVAAGLAVPLYYSVPIGLAIGLLTLIVVISYGQTLHAYPTGGGAYTVAKENLGITAALIAGACLLIDYVLTVAVSVAAGIAAVTSAVPALFEYRVHLCLFAVGVILLANLRGVRESAAVFAGPVYAFILSAFLLVIVGLVRYGMEGAPPKPAESLPSPDLAWNAAMVFLVLRAFASGCAALTGIEAVAQGVRVFQPPVARNASIVLYTLAGLLASLFLGITLLAYLYGVVPHADAKETVVSQLARSVFDTGPLYYLVQAATMAILILAANTSYTGFPRLASVMAQDRFLPRQLANMGDRLVYSNGILLLSLFAAALIVLFNAQVHSLIPLYMIGVFTAFTLSQAGMVVHWRKEQSPGRSWRVGVNAFGALATGLVLVVVAIVKFQEGAWIIVAAIPLMVVACRAVRQHYYMTVRELSLADYEMPREIRHTAVIPVAGMNKMVLAAVEYARSISRDVIAVTINVDNADREKLLEEWQARVPDVPLVILESPYRAIHRPLLRFIDEAETWRGDDIVTVVIPEFISKSWWHHFLHNQTSLFLKAALLFKPRIIVTSVPYHMRR